MAPTLALNGGTYSYTGTAATLAQNPVLARLIASRRIWHEFVPTPDWVWSPPIRNVWTARVLALASGAYNYTGTAASFLYQPVLAALIASRRIWHNYVPEPDWVWSPPIKALVRPFALSLGSGAYNYAGTAATFIYQPVLAALIASRRIWHNYAVEPDWTWQPPAVKPNTAVAYILSAASGAYNYTGAAVALASQPVLAALIASRRIWNHFTPESDWTWQPPAVKPNIAVAYILSAASGVYNYTGTAVALASQPVLAALIASRRIWHNHVPDADWVWQPVSKKTVVVWSLLLGSGSYAYNGTAATFQRGINLAIAGGSYIYTGATNITLTLRRAGQTAVDWLVRARRRGRR